MRLGFSVIVCLALGCSSEAPTAPRELGGAEPEPPAEVEEPAKAEVAPPDPETLRAEAVESLLATIDELAQLHRRHADDCAALAGAIREFHKEHGAALASVSADVHAHIDADEAMRLRMRSAMELVMSAGMKCREDPTFVAAQREIFGG